MPSKKTRGWGWRWGLGLAGVAFEPTDIGGCLLWLDADAITGLSDGDPVTTWSDQSGNGNDVAQSTTAKKPTYKTGIINSLPVVRFDGTDDGLVGADNLSTATQGTIFVVAQLTTGFGDNQTLFSTSDEGSILYWFLCKAYLNSGDSKPYMTVMQRDNDTYDRILGNTTIVAATRYLFVFQSSGTAYSLRLNGSGETETVDNGADTGDWFGDTGRRDNFVIGMFKRSTESQWLDGDVAELIVYDSSLSAENIAQVETYLNSRWSIY